MNDQLTNMTNDRNNWMNIANGRLEVRRVEFTKEWTINISDRSNGFFMMLFYRDLEYPTSSPLLNGTFILPKRLDNLDENYFISTSVQSSTSDRITITANINGVHWCSGFKYYYSVSGDGTTMTVRFENQNPSVYSCDGYYIM